MFQELQGLKCIVATQGLKKCLIQFGIQYGSIAVVIVTESCARDVSEVWECTILKFLQNVNNYDWASVFFA